VTRVLVTGASGFVGSALTPVLEQAGYEVVAAVRTLDAPVAGNAKSVRVGTIGPRTDWSEALKDVAAVVHLAAMVHVRESEGELEAFRAVNVAGTERLARAARDAGARRFVFVSSIGVHGGRTVGRPFDESSPLAPHTAYVRSKAEAEQALLRVSAGAGLQTVVLRPPLVYGPGNPGNLERLLRLIELGIPLPFGSISNRRSFIFSKNLAHCIAACISHPAAAGRTFVVRDGEDISTPELIDRLARELGRPSRLFPFPALLLRIGSRLVGHYRDLDRLVSDLAVDDSEIRRALGWVSPYTLEQGLAATATWWRNRDRSER
jgi:nucleoside-diphosphate-sugar epimerase